MENPMTFEDAAQCCHVRSAIYRASDPERLYWKNSLLLLHEQVPPADQLAHDWEEYDPREGQFRPHRNDMI
jgi:hypothetical protein